MPAGRPAGRGARQTFDGADHVQLAPRGQWDGSMNVAAREFTGAAAALAFHHLDPRDKCFTRSHRGVTRCLAAARAEARKCVLLCANCHAEVESGIRTLPSGRPPAVE